MLPIFEKGQETPAPSTPQSVFHVHLCSFFFFLFFLENVLLFFLLPIKQVENYK